MDIAGVMNRPERDDQLLRVAGLGLERALFPLLVLVERFEPVGVVDLGDCAGRDHTTVSRQLTRLEELGLVTRTPSGTDRRVREAVVTPAGRAATDALAQARSHLAGEVFADWSPADVKALLRLLDQLVTSLDHHRRTSSTE